MSLITRKTRIDAEQVAAIIGSSGKKVFDVSHDSLAGTVFYLLRRVSAPVLSTIIWPSL